MTKPFVVVVAGRPGSGKTTLAHKLVGQIHCTALCRDEFKEGYVNSIVVCTVDPYLAKARFIERGLANFTRERFHGDKATLSSKEGIELLVGKYYPPEMDLPTLTVDTTDGYSPTLEQIIAFVMRPKTLIGK
ncbi:ATP-binding protein [Cyanobacteria bacterium FACHB-471]|nr:ATP-binding protein [Cyanobacteria bacterium FACHB-471]